MKRAVLMTAAVVATLPALQARPCTVAVISAAGSSSGRPMLWKNRDSDFEANRVMAFSGERFAFIGVVNSEDLEGTEVWAGTNQAGLCLMNSASYNLNAEKEEADATTDGRPRKDEEGLLMKEALGRCATVDELERYLEETNGARGVEANFGAIDAEGGAAFFETGNARFVRLDATDQRVAPHGYIVRTNYSFTGVPGEGAGYIRYDRISSLFLRQSATGGISRDWILGSASRDMVNALTGSDPLSEPPPAHARDSRYYYMADSIARPWACSTTLFEGVEAGHDPGRTVMWVRLGHPLTSVALPTWVEALEASRLLTGSESAPIDELALAWWRQIFPLKGGSRDRYMDLAPLVNRADGGLLPALLQIETALIVTTDRLLAGHGSDPAVLREVQRRVEDTAIRLLVERFPEAAGRLSAP